MEGNSNLTEEELREAGASGAYIAYYKTAKRMGLETNSTNHAEKIVTRGISQSGGGFHDAIWNDEARYSGDNPYGADSKNKRILREAGIYKAEDGLIA